MHAAAAPIPMPHSVHAWWKFDARSRSWVLPSLGSPLFLVQPTPVACSDKEYDCPHFTKSGNASLWCKSVLAYRHLHWGDHWTYPSSWRWQNKGNHHQSSRGKFPSTLHRAFYNLFEEWVTTELVRIVQALLLHNQPKAESPLHNLTCSALLFGSVHLPQPTPVLFTQK